MKKLISVLLTILMLTGFAGIVASAQPHNATLEVFFLGQYVAGCNNDSDVAWVSLFQITSNTSWTVTSNVDWIRFSKENGQQNHTLRGSGNFDVHYYALTNPSHTSRRTGTITIATDCGIVITQGRTQYPGCPPWYANMPSWAQWLLRWVLFGWLWM